MKININTAIAGASLVLFAAPAFANPFEAALPKADTASQLKDFAQSQMQAKSYAQTNDYRVDAHTACKSDENKRKLAGGALGTVAGGLAGAKIAGKDDRTKGAVIGGVVGGVAGYGIADKTVDCDPVFADETVQTTSQSGEPAAYIYDETHPASTTAAPSNSTYHTNTTYGSASTTQAGSYPVRTIVSNHPVYSNPGYVGSTHVQQPTVYRSVQYTTQTQPNVIYARHTTSTTNAQPVYYTRPVVRTHYDSSGTAPIRYMASGRLHHHGKHECRAQH